MSSSDIPAPTDQVEQTLADDAVIALVVHAASQVPGMVGLHRRRPVEVARGAGGELIVTLALVSATDPPPRDVVAAVGRAVRDALSAAAEPRVDLEITVTDVHP